MLKSSHCVYPVVTIPVLSFYFSPVLFFQFLFTNHIDFLNSQLIFFERGYEIIAIKIK